MATAIDDRLAGLRLQVRELAARSKVSETTIRELRYNTHQRKRPARTLEELSVALGWPRDYLTIVLRGEATPDESPAAIVQLRDRVDFIRARVDGMDTRLEENTQLLRQAVAMLEGLTQVARGDRDVPR